MIIRIPLERDSFNSYVDNSVLILQSSETYGNALDVSVDVMPLATVDNRVLTKIAEALSNIKSPMSFEINSLDRDEKIVISALKPYGEIVAVEIQCDTFAPFSESSRKKRELRIAKDAFCQTIFQLT